MHRIFNSGRAAVVAFILALSLALAPAAAAADCSVFQVETGEGILGSAICSLNVWLTDHLGSGGAQCIEIDGYWFFVTVDCGVVAEVTVTVD